MRSHTVSAEGGAAAVVPGSDDSLEKHAYDTVKGSDWGAEQDVVRRFVENAPIAVRQMAYWGVPWNRVVAGERVLPDGSVVVEAKEKEGLIAARNFGGTKKWRACYCSDGTGHSLVYAMDNVVLQLGIDVHTADVVLGGVWLAPGKPLLVDVLDDP